MNTLISCGFNMDTACVELKYADGTMISIDTIAVENEVANNMVQRSELDLRCVFPFRVTQKLQLDTVSSSAMY